MMDLIQDEHERAVGDAFVVWYNDQKGTGYQFHGRAGEAPDLIYRDGEREMRLEITVAYYDEKAATFEWQNARGVAKCTQDWCGVEPDQKLIESINEALTKKCQNRYGPNCFLVMKVVPRLTLAKELKGLLNQVAIPPSNTFKGIYLTGNFPVGSGDSAGGYHCWKLAESP